MFLIFCFKVIILAKVLYSLMKGSAAKQKQISLNLYLICGVLISLSEDGAFIEQLYESVNKIEVFLIIFYFHFRTWKERELDGLKENWVAQVVLDHFCCVWVLI